MIHSDSNRRQNQRGVALIFILGSLVLLSVMMLAFLGSVTTELKSSKIYADGSSVRLLADSVVNIVINQLKLATSGRDSSGNRLAWASQPGMIRTYDTSGNPAIYYKLYSAPHLTGTGTFDANNDDRIDSSWKNETAIYTDLNEAILGRYPIIDPRAVGIVKGFSIDTGAQAVGGTSQYVPMPVKWLYVLQDGTVASPAAGSSGTRAIITEATANNPIVARIAYWSDDETCKVNINTASEGCFWDTPRIISPYEKTQLASNQPVRNEYQRYPGHPAMTCLSAVFDSLLPVSIPATNTETTPYYQLAPRIKSGGSLGASVAASTTSAVINFTPQDRERLYATVDELEFAQNRKDLPSSTASIPITAEELEKRRFFLTANSRSPDVNLFNKPRVGIWPLSLFNDEDHRTALDRMIAFCGTIASYPYYFQRQDPNSPDTDLAINRNRQLLTYLQELTKNPIPGFNGDFQAKYGSDREQILTEIFDYIRCTNISDKGDRPSFSAYTPQNAITTSGAVGQGQVVPIYDSTNDTRGFGRFPTISEATLIFYYCSDATLSASFTPTNKVPPGSIAIRALFLPEFFTPAYGWNSECNSFKIEVEGLETFKFNGSLSLNLPDKNSSKYAIETTAVGATLAPGTMFGANKDIRSFNSDRELKRSGTDTQILPTFSDPPLIVSASTPISFGGGTATISIRTRDTNNPAKDGILLQSITVNFPQITSLPLPRLPSTDNTSDATKPKKLDLLRFTATPNVPDGSGEISSTLSSTYGRFHDFGSGYGSKVACITRWDTVRGISVKSGDFRMVAGRQKIAVDELFGKLADYFSTGTMSHTLFGFLYPYHGATRGRLVKDATYYNASQAITVNSVTNFSAGGLTIITSDQDTSGINGVAMGKETAISSGDIPGDWDNGVGDYKDGPYINKPDEGTLYREGSDPPYFGTSMGRFVMTYSVSSPNRQIPSAAMFGSLPTGVKANSPWQTLLFRPGPSPFGGGSKAHAGVGYFGAASAPAPPYTKPPDYLLLDLFHMPVVEPYPISEPLSTAGRINMNYQIVPFTYIERSTAVRAAMKAERILAVPFNAADAYKRNGTNARDYRFNIDLDETLKGFQARFDAKDIFRSASEICSLWLVPQTDPKTTYANASSFWNGDDSRLTGDNSRERPYANIYPRLTTQSNVYTVHYRVQTLQKPKARLGSSPTEFDTTRGDTVTGEYRGSSLIERYVDPNDSALTGIDFADVSGGRFDDPAYDVSSYYKYRVIGSKKFTP